MQTSTLHTIHMEDRGDVLLSIWSSDREDISLLVLVNMFLPYTTLYLATTSLDSPYDSYGGSRGCITARTYGYDRVV